jgi:imidazolonepropionase-like amidohydrolase
MRLRFILGALAFGSVGGPIETAAQPLQGRADAHVHLSYGPDSDLDSLLARGITVVRDAGGDLQQLARWRAEIASGARRGPRILIAGPLLDGPKPGADFRLTVVTVADADAAVDSLARAGVDFIKTHSAVPPDAFFAIVRRARLRGLRVAAHLPSGVPAWVAADSGVGSIEHAAESLVLSPIHAGFASDAEGALRWWESAAGDSALRRLARSGVSIVPTLVRYEAAIAVAPTAEGRSARAAALPRLQRLVGRLHRAGVPILVGSDLVGLPGSIPQWAGSAREIELLVASGFTPEEASAAASPRALLDWFRPR